MDLTSILKIENSTEIVQIPNNDKYKLLYVYLKFLYDWQQVMHTYKTFNIKYIQGSFTSNEIQPDEISYYINNYYDSLTTLYKQIAKDNTIITSNIIFNSMRNIDEYVFEYLY